MKTDIILYSQIIILILNIIIFFYLLREHNLQHKFVRVLLLIAITIGGLSNFGKVSIYTILFMFSPFLTLIKFNPNGKLHRIIEKLRHHIRGHKQSVQNVEGNN